MTQMSASGPSLALHGYGTARLAGLALLAMLTLLPVTLPVTVLRGLVQERFAVSELATSLFMSINMVGAVIAAPLSGALADRWGRRVPLVAGALALDGALLFALTREIPFALFMALRFAEGAAHIAALSLLLGLASHARGAAQRGRVMGLVGGGITLGVAIGAPIGGVLGRDAPLVPLYVGSAVLLTSAPLALLFLRETEAAEARPSLAAIAHAVGRHRLLLAPFAFSFVDRFTVGFYTTTFSLFLSRIHGLDSAQIGALMAAFMLPFALLSYPFGRLSERHLSRVAMIAIGTTAYGLATTAVGFAPREWLVPLMLCLGLTSAVMFVPSLLITTDIAPEQIRTTAMGAFNAAGSLGFIVGPLTGGLVSQLVADRFGWETGYRAAFGVAGASAILCASIALPFLLRLRRTGRTT
jgi:MFS family permease